MQKQVSPKIVALAFGILVTCFAVGFYIFAWTGPTATPPNENKPAPVNVGSEAQTKQGGLKINSVLETIGFKVPTGAGAGKVLTSDGSGLGSWQTPPLGESVLVNYGGCGDYGECSISPCPAGWTEAGSGNWITHAFYDQWSTYHQYRAAARTCFRTDKVCQALVNYGGCGDYGECSISPCPAGWTEAGSGNWITHAFYDQWSTYHQYRAAARTCFKCF